MTVGNIPSEIRNKPNNHCWVPIALLPVGPKRLHKKAGWSVQKQEKEQLEVIQNLIQLLLRPISASAGKGKAVKCGDGVKRMCYFRLGTWLADHQENCTIHSIYNNRCPICECPVAELGEYSLRHRKRQSKEYAEWFSNSDVESLRAAGVKNVQNALWRLRDVMNPCDIVRPDLLHNMYLGNLEYLMEWIEGFLTVHNRLSAFDDVWFNISRYPGNCTPQKPYRYLTQVQGKEMRAIHQIILGVFTASLRRKTDLPKPTGAQDQEFKRAIEAVRYLTDFGLLARYRSHTDSTVGYMTTYLRRFHRCKDVFLRYRAGKKARNRADAISKELTEEFASRKASEIPLTGVKRARVLQDEQEERAYRIAEALEDDSDFNFPKMHMLLHYVDQIKQYGSLPQYSTEICETLHKTFKDAYRRSNHVDSIPQIIQGYTREHNFAVHEMTLKAWGENNPDIMQQYSDIARPKRKESNITPSPDAPIYMRLEGPQSIKEIYNLQHLSMHFNIIDIEQEVTEFLMLNAVGSLEINSDVGSWISDAPIRVYNGVQIPVPDQDVAGQNSYKYQHLRATGKKGWRGGKGRRDPVWVNVKTAKLRLQSSNGRIVSFSNRLPAYLNTLFSLKVPSGSLLKLAHVTLLEPIGNPTPHGPEGMFAVRKWSDGNKIVWLKCLEGAVHLIPLEPEGQWLVNNRIDHQTWNMYYDLV